MLRLTLATALLATIVSAQNNCYYGPGSGFRGPSNLVPCNASAEISACCLRGDTCLTGNACYNYASGNVYQYGCTDLNYEDESCPRKCSFDPSKSPWAGLEYCNDIPDTSDTWTCLSPESCGCEWNSTIGYSLALLPSRGCGAMGSDARVALYAPSTLLPYISLPHSADGSTGYYSTTTDADGNPSIISTAVAFYTPNPQDFVQPTTYRDAPTTAVYINAAATASPSTLSPASIWTATTPYTPPATTSAASTSSNTASTASTASTVSTATESTAAAASISSSSSSGGLSTGAQVGIGVGVAGGVLFAAALGICFYLSRRKKKQNAAQQPPQPPPQQQQPPFDPNYPPQMAYMQPSPPQMQMHGSNWAPVYPPGQVPYFVPPQQHKESVPTPHSAPPYSPPSSPPPTELDSMQRAPEPFFEADSVVSASGHSPRPRTVGMDTRFSEGPT